MQHDSNEDDSAPPQPSSSLHKSDHKEKEKEKEKGKEKEKEKEKEKRQVARQELRNYQEAEVRQRQQTKRIAEITEEYNRLAKDKRILKGQLDLEFQNIDWESDPATANHTLVLKYKGLQNSIRVVAHRLSSAATAASYFEQDLQDRKNNKMEILASGGAANTCKSFNVKSQGAAVKDGGSPRAHNASASHARTSSKSNKP